MVWLLDFLAEKNVDTQLLVETHQLSGLLNGLDVSVSGATHRALLSDALHLTQNDGLGLELGTHRSLATFDQLAYLMMSSSTLRESTKQGLRYQNYPGRFSGEAIHTDFIEVDGQGCFEVSVNENLGELRLLVIEELLSNIVATTRWVLGRPLPLTKLRCDYPAPPHFADYEAIFDCPIQFDTPVIQLLFDVEVLDASLPNASPQSARLYASLCEEQSIARQPRSIASRVGELIAETPSHPPDMGAVAEELHCSSRTLRRKLQAEGWHYHQLIDQIRVVRARRALSDPLVPITAIALELGFADHSGFLRAFKKWTGLTPTEFRNRLFSQ